MEEGCFKGNKRLKRVFFEGMASIADDAFDDCDSLTFLGLLGNDMKDFTFNISPSKTHFKKILCMSTTVPNISSFCSSIESVYVPTEALNSYEKATPWNIVTIVPLHNRRIYFEEKQLSAGDTVYLYPSSQNTMLLDNSDIYSYGQWILEDAEDGLFYIKSATGNYMCDRFFYYTNVLTFSTEKSEATKVKISWYVPEASFVIQSTTSGGYLSSELTYYASQTWGHLWVKDITSTNVIFDITSAPLLSSKLNINPSDETIKKRSTVQLNTTVSPNNAGQPTTYKWATSDNGTALVDSHGLVYGLNPGKAIITVTATNVDGSVLTDSCRVAVINADDDIADNEKAWIEVTDSNIERLSSGSIIKIRLYGSETANLTVYPQDQDAHLARCDYQNNGDEWTLVGDEDGGFYFINDGGSCWTSTTPLYTYAKTKTSLEEACKVKFLWDSTYRGFLLKNLDSNTYLCGNTRFVWKYDSVPTPHRGFSDGNLFNVYVASKAVMVESVQLNHEEATLTIGESLQLSATVLPEDATNKNISWSSSDESIATVSTDGLVTAVHAGTATITASTTDGTNLSATCVVTVKAMMVESVQLNHEEATLTIGESLQLSATVLPEDATNKNISWSSSNESIATVSTDGLVTAVHAGTATITASTTDGTNLSATCVITSKTVMVESVQLNHEEATLTIGESLQLSATVLPEDATNKNISWSSSDESIATVSADGLVTAVHAGTATITASTTDGTNLSATCVVTVLAFGSEEWVGVTNSNIGSLTGGSVVKICPYGYAGYENAALSSSTGDATYSAYVLTATEYAGQEGGNKWTLIGAGDGTFYLRNGVGLYWAFQQSDAENYFMGTVSDQSEAVKVSLVWNDTYSGVAFKNAYDGTYLCNLGGYNFAYNWYNGDQPLTADTNYTYNVYVSSNKESGIDGVSVDGDTDVVYYQLNGVKLAGKPQQDGIYIRVKDGKSQKIVVRKK